MFQGHETISICLVTLFILEGCDRYGICTPALSQNTRSVAITITLFAAFFWKVMIFTVTLHQKSEFIRLIVRHIFFISFQFLVNNGA